MTNPQALSDQIGKLLGEDPVCMGRVWTGTIEAIAALTSTTVVTAATPADAREIDVATRLRRSIAATEVGSNVGMSYEFACDLLEALTEVLPVVDREITSKPVDDHETAIDVTQAALPQAGEVEAVKLPTKEALARAMSPHLWDECEIAQAQAANPYTVEHAQDCALGDAQEILDRLAPLYATPPSVIPAAAVERNPMTDRHINWLVHQLEAWPTRVHPELTTSITYLMQEAAKTIRAQYLPTPSEGLTERYREAASERIIDLLTKAVGDITAALIMAGKEDKLREWTAPYIEAINAYDAQAEMIAALAAPEKDA